jgi:hypothetical protein
VMLLLGMSCEAAAQPGAANESAVGHNRTRANLTATATRIPSVTLSRVPTMSLPPTPSRGTPSATGTRLRASASEMYYDVKTETPSRSAAPSRSATVTGTDSAIPEPPARPLVKPWIAASSIAATVGVSVLSSAVLQTSAASARTAQLLVLAAWAPCGNESLRATFENVSAVALAFELFAVDAGEEGLPGEGRDASLLPRLAALLLLAGLAAAIHATATAAVYVHGNRRGASPPLLWHEAQVRCFAPGLGLHAVSLPLPGVVFAALRSAAFSPRGVRRSDDSSLGAVALAAAALALVMLAAAAAAGVKGTPFVRYRFTFDDEAPGSRCGRAAFPPGYWAATPEKRRLGWFFANARPSVGRIGTTAEILVTCIVAVLLAVDASAFGGTRIGGCRYVLWPAASVLLAGTVWSIVTTRVPGGAWAQASFEAAVAALLFVQGGDVPWPDASGAALVGGILVIAPVAALGHVYFAGLDLLRWRRAERQLRQELSSEWVESVHGDAVPRGDGSDGSAVLLAPIYDMGGARGAPPEEDRSRREAAPLPHAGGSRAEPGPLRTNPWRHDTFMRVL